MTTAAALTDHLILDITEHIDIRSSITATFAALLEELGPSNQGHQGGPMPMTLEPWPGGRWFRDLGDGNGHLWGHVQAIKRPTLLEIAGPLMMSFAVASNVQYRLAAIDGGTRLTLRHTALGLFPDGYREALTGGFTAIGARVQRRAEQA
ncbi:MAG TPA: SRPBCC domain-containing protein [Vicinamibacterales bacterium]|nr:SRPBCC domain-containing protein [Vicinamibacterales bacterium]